MTPQNYQLYLHGLRLAQGWSEADARRLHARDMERVRRMDGGAARTCEHGLASGCNRCTQEHLARW